MGIERHGAADDLVAVGLVFARKLIQIALKVFADPDF
jgi:hypothetical protein